jgi:predicted glycosyltransferase
LAAYLKIPVLPTGYVRVGSSPPWQPAARHWVASCGSGRGDGYRFSQAVLDAQRHLSVSDWRLTLVCGRETWEHIQSSALALPAQTTLMPWTDDLPGLLATATVSVSQCGYNTGLEVLGSGVPAIFVPYVEPRTNEQRLRAEAIAAHPGFQVIPPFVPDLAERLAEAVITLAETSPAPPVLDLGGAATSARLVAELVAKAAP